MKKDMAISVSKTREEFPLSTKKILKKTLEDALIWGLLLLVVYFITSLLLNGSPEFFNSHPTLKSIYSFLANSTLIFFLLIMLLTYGYQKWYYNFYFYDLTQDFIIIKKGPILPREITIPYERVQDVYVDQDILDRIFGLYDVHLSSATISSGMEAHIDGVEKQVADGLRKKLLETVQHKMGKNKGRNENAQ